MLLIMLAGKVQQVHLFSFPTSKKLQHAAKAFPKVSANMHASNSMLAANLPETADPPDRYRPAFEILLRQKQADV